MKRMSRRTEEQLKHAPLWDIAEAGRMTGYCAAFLYDKIKQNRLPAYGERPAKVDPTELLAAIKAEFPVVGGEQLELPLEDTAA